MVLSGLPLPGLFIGSATQWNEEYAVTASHTPLVKKVAYRPDNNVDVLFIKRKAKNGVPEWRDGVPGEKVFSMGYNIGYIRVAGEGVMSDTTMAVNNKDFDSNLIIHSAPVTSGMSGGPVYGEDGKVIGMTLGNATVSVFYEPLTEHSAYHIKPHSLALTYRDIKAEWDKYQSTK